MKIVFHERYREVYTSDPAAASGRLDSMVEELSSRYDFVEPSPAEAKDLLLVHPESHIKRIRKTGLLYEIALLAAGGALKAAELAVEGEPAFAAIRPPGHHASPNSCWGFCWFNNVAIAVEKMKQTVKINNAVIVDIDLHYGDGTSNIFANDPQVKYNHLGTMRDLEKFLNSAGPCDLVAISAGFDRHIDDWGGMLETEDYREIGKMIGNYAREYCPGKIFSVLEGGYNQDVLGKNACSLLEGLEDGKIS